MRQEKEWFENWFDTPFYHILYDYRNDEEAKGFMTNLITHLQLNNGEKILDLPCGKGRHSLFLNSLGYDVTGADLSVNSITHASQFEKPGLSFQTHDMRDPLKGTYDAIFNLFTSFGYFNQESTNITVMENFRNALKEGGHLVIDFLNLDKVKQELIPEQQLTKKGMDFLIKKHISDDFIVKEIEIHHKNEVHHFVEKVQALDLAKMKYFADMVHLEIQDIFGDYDLAPFNRCESDRLILVMQ